MYCEQFLIPLVVLVLGKHTEVRHSCHRLLEDHVSCSTNFSGFVATDDSMKQSSTKHGVLFVDVFKVMEVKVNKCVACQIVNHSKLISFRS
jgi:hypothetical protein